MSIDALFPANGDNAIVQVAFIVEWNAPLEDGDLGAIKELAPSLANELPDLQESQSFSVTFDTQGARGTSQQVAQVNGVHFLKIDHALGGKLIRALQVNRNNLIAIVSDYDRWAAVWERVSRWFEAVAEAVGNHRGIHSITLQYTDSFIWRDSPGTLNLNEVFSRGSPYLPPHVYSLPTLWHSHHGYIDAAAEPKPCQIINNVNVDLVDKVQGRVININSSHKAILAEPIWNSGEFTEVQKPLFELLHAKNKKSMSELLSPDVCNRIGLKPQEKI